MEGAKDKEASYAAMCGAGGLLTTCCCGLLSLPLSIMGIVFGVRHLGAIRRGEAYTGKASAWLGVVMGAAGLLFQVGSLVFYLGVLGMGGDSPFAPDFSDLYEPPFVEPSDDGGVFGLQLPSEAPRPVEVLDGPPDATTAQIELVHGEPLDPADLAAQLGFPGREVIAVLHADPRWLPLGAWEAVAILAPTDAPPGDVDPASWAEGAVDPAAGVVLAYQPTDCHGAFALLRPITRRAAPAVVLHEATGRLVPYRLRPVALQDPASASLRRTSRLGGEPGFDALGLRATRPGDDAPYTFRFRLGDDLLPSRFGEGRTLYAYAGPDGELSACLAP